MSSALSSDLDVLKDIPGYKAILKSVLKTQIQLLIEQLADHTGEESIILTASVNDGTLSHLGSSTGKGFLDGRDEIKSQFLGFCLKSHHKKKTQEVKSPYQRVNHGNQGQRHIPQRPPQKRPKLHPVTLQRAGSLEGHTGLPQRPVGVPPSPRDDRGPSMSPGMSPRLVRAGDENVKLEGNEQNDSNSESSNFASTPTSFPSTLQLSHTQTSGDQSYSETSHDIGQGQGSQNVGHGQGQLGAEEFNDSAAETSIKIEPITENEMELEITGVEPGNMSSDNWGQGQMGYGPSGSEGDDSQNQSGDQSGYNNFSAMNHSYGGGAAAFKTPQSPLNNSFYGSSTIRSHPYDGQSPSQYGGPAHTQYGSPVPTQHTSGGGMTMYSCQYCGKQVRQKCDLVRHIRKHTGERPYRCDICGRGFSRNESLNVHKFTRHLNTDSPYLGESTLPNKD